MKKITLVLLLLIGTIAHAGKPDPELEYRLSTLVPKDQIIPREVQQRIDRQRSIGLMYPVVEPSSIPDEMDFRDKDTPVQKQTRGTCTAFALVASMENVLNDETKLSEDHLWSLYRQYSLAPAIKAATRNAITPLEFWPLNGRPSRDYLEKAHHSLGKYEYLESDMNKAFEALAQEIPVYLGFIVTNSVVNCDTHADPYSPVMNSGHAVEIVGYDQEKKEFLVKNSWGRSCGEKGYMYLPYEYCQRNGMYCMMYSIQEVANNNKEGEEL